MVAIRWAVVGGGLLGMHLADRFRASGCDVVLFEAAGSLGGLAAPWELGDVVWDRHYHVTLESDTYVLALLEQLGLSAAIRWRSARTGVYAGGHLYSVSNALEFLRFPGVGLVDRVRIGLTVLLAAAIRDPEALSALTVEDWLIRWSGARAFARFWRPLLRSKLGDLYTETPATFIWATIARLYAARRAGLKQERFGYVEGGYRTVIDAFEGSLRSSGVDIRKSTPVFRVGRAGRGVLVESTLGSETFDRVAVTVPAPLAIRMCPDFDDADVGRLRKIRYLGIACASLLLKRGLSPFYTINLTDEGFPFTGVIEMTAFVGRDAVGGHSLVYLPKYCRPDDPILSEDDGAIQVRFLAGLRRIYPELKDEDIVAFRISKVPYVFALPPFGGGGPIPMATSIPGVFLVNSAQITEGTLNVNETLALGEIAVKRLSNSG